MSGASSAKPLTTPAAPIDKTQENIKTHFKKFNCTCKLGNVSLAYIKLFLFPRVALKKSGNTKKLKPDFFTFNFLKISFEFSKNFIKWCLYARLKVWGFYYIPHPCRECPAWHSKTKNHQDYSVNPPTAKAVPPPLGKEGFSSRSGTPLTRKQKCKFGA